MSEAARSHPKGRERLFDAAEALFSDKGYFGASLRDITQAAGVPLGLANYHFGSKDELYREVLLRRAPQMSAALNKALDKALVDRTGLHGIFAAYAAPHLERMAGEELGWRNYIRLAAVSSLQIERDDLVRPATEAYKPTMSRFSAAIAEAAPHADPVDLARAFYIFRMSVLAIAADRKGRDLSPKALGDLTVMLTRMAASGCAGV